MKLKVTKTVSGKHFKLYQEVLKKKGIKVPTKAEFLKRTLKLVHAQDEHLEWIDFYPAQFTLQLHGWFDEGTYRNLSEIKKVINSALKRKIDPIAVLKGKWHYDLRVLKHKAPAWFGCTLFRAPFTSVPEDKAQGTVKGYQAIAKGNVKELQKFLREKAQAAMATEGVAERRDMLFWFNLKEKFWTPPGAGTPTSQPGAMVAIEFQQPAVLHRRELDFWDITYLGKYFNGRYYFRLVERKLRKDELQLWQIKEIETKKKKAFYGLGFYMWRGKKSFRLNVMKRVAKRKQVVEPINVDDQKDFTISQVPRSQTWKFRRGGKLISVSI